MLAAKTGATPEYTTSKDAAAARCKQMMGTSRRAGPPASRPATVLGRAPCSPTILAAANSVARDSDTRVISNPNSKGRAAWREQKEYPRAPDNQASKRNYQRYLDRVRNEGKYLAPRKASGLKREIGRLPPRRSPGKVRIVL